MTCSALKRHKAFVRSTTINRHLGSPLTIAGDVTRIDRLKNDLMPKVGGDLREGVALRGVGMSDDDPPDQFRSSARFYDRWGR